MKYSFAFFIILSSLYIQGCATTKDYNFKESVIKASTDPMTWTNLLAGIVFSVGELDENATRSILRQPYIFSSQNKASNYSNKLRMTTRISMNVSSLLVEEDNAGDYYDTTINKSVRFLTDNLNAGIVATTTGDIQVLTDKIRPNNNCCGFPSAHTSRAFATAFIARKNYQQSNLPLWAQNSAIITTYLSAYMTGYARIESKSHYPSQVFIGAAYGNFVSSLLYDATNAYLFPVTTHFWLDPDEMMLSFSYSF